MRKLLCTAALLLAAAVAFTQDRDVMFRGEFPVDYMVPPSPEGFQELTDPSFIAKFPDTDSAKAVLAEASWVFSGMIWGFDYVYTPSDKTRKVDEFFSVTPRGSIVEGDPGLRVESVRREGSVIMATITYLLAKPARSEYAAWSGAMYYAAQGKGIAPSLPPVGLLSPAGRVQDRKSAMSFATREALREFLRGRTHNKPREVRGTCAFASVPRLSIISGSYVSNVRLRVSVTEIIPYGKY